MAISFVFTCDAVKFESLYLYSVLIIFSVSLILFSKSSSFGIDNLELCLVSQLKLSNTPI